MAVVPDTTTGTITLTSGSANFATTGTNMLTRGHKPGDTIHRNGFVLIIDTITGENAGTLTENCPAAAAGAGVAVRIRFQPDGSRVPAQARNLIDAIGAIVDRFVAATATVAAKIIFLEGTNNGANKVTLKAPDALAADRVFTMPDIDVTMHPYSAQFLDDPDGPAVMNTIGALPKAGGSMTGDLTIAKTAPSLALNAAAGNPTLILNKKTDADFNIIYARVDNITRWGIFPGYATTNDLVVFRYDATGAFVDVPFALKAATGVTEVTKIKFPSTAALSTDPYTLDDYREFTWTPNLVGFTVVNGTGGWTYSGTGTRIGRLLHATAQFAKTGTATIASPGGYTTYISNWPFATVQYETFVGSDDGLIAYCGGQIRNNTAYMMPWSARNNDFWFSATTHC